MSVIIKVISQIFSGVVGVLGIVLLFAYPLAGLLMIAWAIIIFPGTKGLIQNKFGSNQSGMIKAGVIAVLIIATGITMAKSGSSDSQDNKQVASMEQSAPVAEIQKDQSPEEAQNTPTPAPVEAETPKASVQEVVQETPPPAPIKSDQELLEDDLKQVASKHKSSVNYRGVDIDGKTKIMTANFDVLDFWSRNILIHDTGNISAEIFKAIFTSKLSTTDAEIRYYGKTKDRYGNESDSIVLSYGMDKTTYDKINWSNFTSMYLCDFLKEEMRANPGTMNSCFERVKIE